MASQVSWKNQISILEEDAENIIRLKKQIVKESEIDVSIQNSINDKIQSLKLNATILAKRLENEKHKHTELEMIIHCIKQKMSQQKFIEATHRNDINFQNIPSLQNNYKKLQYDLGQLNGRSNKLGQNISQKRSKVNQLRTERVIDSGIFRNIEKQLNNSEFGFKKLMIEKIKYQKQYEKFLKEYTELKLKSQASNQKRQSSNSKLNTNVRNTEESHKVSQQISKKFIELEPPSFKPSHYKIISQRVINEQKQQQQQKKEIIIKKILIETGLDHVQQLLNHFQNVQQMNDQYFQQMNNYIDKINQMEKQIGDISKNKGENMLTFYEKKRKLNNNEEKYLKTRHYNQRISTTKRQIEEQLSQMSELLGSQEFQAFLKQVQIKKQTPSEANLTNFDEITQSLQQLQQEMKDIMTNKINEVTIINDTTTRTNKSEKLDDLMSRVQKVEECDKIMKKQDFKDEYQKALKKSQKSIHNKTKKKSGIYHKK